MYLKSLKTPYLNLFYYLLTCLIEKANCENLPGNITDTSLCKVTHLGLDFSGQIGRTESGVRCQSWTATKPVHKVDETFTDTMFSDRSMKRARNYCRNPNRDSFGPWCYTLHADLMYETCAIPLCSHTHCRITGPGMDYGGTLNRAVSGQECLKWNKNRNKLKEKSSFRKQETFHKSKFPDEDVKGAKKYCRNPDGDLGGPWCFVDVEDSGAVQKEYCDIPFCDDEDCMVFTKNHTKYTHYTQFKKHYVNLTFGIKLWNPDAYLEASATLLLTLFPLPLHAKKQEDLGIGIEIYLSNEASALRYGNKESWEYEPTFGSIKSTEFSYFSLSWDSGFITLSKQGVTKPIFLAEYKTKNNLLGFKKNQFRYYSPLGENILWNFPFCDEDDNCDVHVTNGLQFQEFWPLRENSVGRDVQFFVRAHHSAYIYLFASPVFEFPCIRILLQRSDDYTRIIAVEYEGGPNTVLKEFLFSNLLKYWTWKEFSISMFSNTLQLHLTKDGGTHLLAEITHPLIKKMLWFSIASEKSVALWTLFCVPPEYALAPPAWLPECALSKDEPGYNGTQGVTFRGSQCLPWAGEKLLPDEVKLLFPGKESFKSWNYCRDPKGELKGTYCYVIDQDKDGNVVKEYCHIRKCKSAECRMAGTGNDYIGQVNTTRSNRTCQFWTSEIRESNEMNLKTSINEITMTDVTHFVSTESNTERIQVHSVPNEYLNGTLYADTSVEKAKNYCRNPSRDVSGSWCYTTDPKVPQDICNIRDCDKPEECIVIAKGNGEGKDVYILPQWKETGPHGGLQFALKEWNPDLSDGISFSIKPFEGEPKIKLAIGADGNEKVQLYYKSKLVKEKTLPHLIASGKWTSFRLQIRRGEILLGFKGVPSNLFEWTLEEEPSTSPSNVPSTSSLFEPRFISYESIKGRPIGIFFKCDECHTEKITSDGFSKIMPIGLWKEEAIVHRNLSLKIRGEGVLTLSFINLPDSLQSYLVSFENSGREIIFFKLEKNIIGDNYGEITNNKLYEKKLGHNLIFGDKWTDLEIVFSEFSMIVYSKNYANNSLLDTNKTLNAKNSLNTKNTLLAKFTSDTPMLLYWFSISAKVGWITWAANCETLDLDGPPIDGGWSDWSKWECSVSCGGGEGFRTRSCSNPRPNIFGKLCEGSATSTGKCNDFPCGDISPNTLETIREHLQHQNFLIMVNQNESAVLYNDHEVLDMIRLESPEAYYEWTLNGVIIDEEPGRAYITNDDLHIENAQKSDGGLYVCMLYRISRQRVVIRVISLGVMSKNWDVSTRATLSLTLSCNSVILGYIYSDLRQKWTLNNTIFYDYGITNLAAVSSETLKNLNMSNTGEWRCVVEQSDLGLSWVTNIMRIQVKSKPTLFTHLMEDQLTAPLFGWLKSEAKVLASLIFIIVVVCVLVGFCLFAYLKWCRLPARRKYQRNRRVK